LSGWIKLEKDLRDDPRVIRMARELRNAGVTHERFTTSMHVTLVLGCLEVLWCYADTHIRQDDTLDLGVDEIDELVGLRGFCKIMPPDWLEVIDANRVKLPDFHSHNGTEAKKKALNQKRQERHRNGVALHELTQTSRTSVTPALPDQDQDQDQNTYVAEATYLALEKQILDAYHELLPDLPAVRDWNDRRKKKLRARIRERVKAGKPADGIAYWRQLFAKAAASDFLCARSKADWRCPGLEWLLEAKNFTKLIEGAYDNPKGDQHGRSYSAAGAAALS
jgi:hypothetical protein